MQYEVTQRFTGGTLAGLTYTGKTNRPPAVGWRCEKPCGGTSPYVIVSVRPIKAGA